ncbi:Dephospho-CoA kinase [Camellia lanceoleosa]|uniref:Dephospho-CoA kinase n=1 Tax=Camellia lanceoleosa TaxID=1840588 RepID=A0ACC0F4T3_9ERIC|nr:Dephospho-CoA kinase [Camellia lanceoleosa]
MSEIFAKSFATGAFARSSRQGVPISDDEREMNERFYAYMSGKGVVDESCTFGSKRKSNGQEESSDEDKDDDEDEDEDEGKGGGEGANEVQGEVGVQNVHENEDGVPVMQQHNHVNMLCEQLLQMGQWRDEENAVSVDHDDEAAKAQVHKNTGQKEAASNSSEEAIVYVKSEDEFFYQLSSWSFRVPLRTQQLASHEDVLKKGTGGWKKAVAAFGEDILQENGQDHKRNDVLWLKGCKVVVLDIPLLFEAKMDKWTKPIIVVWVDPETQLQRLMSRDRTSVEDARNRIQAQMPLDVKITQADIVIDNTGSLEELNERFQKVVVQVTKPLTWTEFALSRQGALVAFISVFVGVIICRKAL